VTTREGMLQTLARLREIERENMRLRPALE
jgi:hypothetical protein